MEHRPLTSSSLAGKVAIVAGTSRGLGAVMVLHSRSGQEGGEGLTFYRANEIVEMQKQGSLFKRDSALLKSWLA